MEKIRNWLGEHKWLVLSGVAGLALFAYLFMRRSSSLTQGAIAQTPSSPAVANTGGAGALNLSSGAPVDLPSNLTPPNCGPGMVAVPQQVNQGQGQPTFLVGWVCQPVGKNPLAQLLLGNVGNGAPGVPVYSYDRTNQGILGYLQPGQVDTLGAAPGFWYGEPGWLVMMNGKLGWISGNNVVSSTQQLNHGTPPIPFTPSR